MNLDFFLVLIGTSLLVAGIVIGISVLIELAALGFVLFMRAMRGGDQ